MTFFLRMRLRPRLVEALLLGTLGGHPFLA